MNCSWAVFGNNHILITWHGWFLSYCRDHFEMTSKWFWQRFKLVIPPTWQRNSKFSPAQKVKKEYPGKSDVSLVFFTPPFFSLSLFLFFLIFLLSSFLLFLLLCFCLFSCLLEKNKFNFVYFKGFFHQSFFLCLDLSLKSIFFFFAVVLS